MPRRARKIDKKDQEIAQLKEQLKQWKVEAAKSKAEEGITIQMLDLEKMLHGVTKARCKWFKDAIERRGPVVDKLNDHILKLTADLSLFKSGSKEREAKRLIDKEHKLVIKYRKKMLEAQAVVRRRQEVSEQEKKPWRFCEICDMEFQYTGLKTPRVLFCGHTFCQECLVKIANVIEVKCPFDSRCTRGYEMHKLPKNFAVLHM
ncbi:hypothetical protein L3Y34_018908 [Caenorhabditis briggsae]|uniref:RING-type domain-containing protein n=1 Tax=Caenorhabditis briggsae TaxID=6238 RepID=A0AAE9DNG3_CAEBR|nr:hypothetical protein L3Y34_018908 [Caenorhabditis briggsae]